MNPKQTIVTIDPGASGGIAVLSKGKITAVQMPETIRDLNDYFEYIKETFEHVVVFIEKVQAYNDDDDTPGKKFGINKMLANYNQLLTCIETHGFKYVEVFPVSWQTTLGLKTGDKNESKTDRKNRYKVFAQKVFPEIQVTLKICDALCLVRFAVLKIDFDIEWIRERLKDPTKQTNQPKLNFGK